MSLTVLSIGYALAPVTPDAVGGAEVVLSQLDAALVARGHRSIVIAPEGSVIEGTLIATDALPAVLDDDARERALTAVRAALHIALAQLPIDVLHFHGVDFADVMPPRDAPALDVPALVTLHLPIDHYPERALESPRRGTVLACVSRSQHADLPLALRERCPVIENGVDLARFRLRERAHGYAIALGRVCPEKNYPDALRAAARAGVPLVLAGRVYPYASHEAHFRDAIAPRLGRGARFLGAIAGPRKARWIGGARCVLVPSIVRETSSLVAMEAMASGTPVIAFRSGALTELIDEGRSGFLVDDVDGMADAIGRAPQLDRRDCRAAAEARFDRERSSARWIALLERVAQHGATHGPRARE